jgi:hypothetical protein
MQRGVAPRSRGAGILLAATLFVVNCAQAGDVAGVQSGATTTTAVTSDTSETQAPKKISKKRVKAPREKETEGTEAPDRFEADTVIKSQYQFDGKQLEVDPD